MYIKMQIGEQSWLLQTSRCIDRLFSFSTIDFLNHLSDILQNLIWLFIIIFTSVILIVSLFSIRRKANKYARRQINHLNKDGKYIPGIFVELNESKEILRYFIYGKKWKERLVQNFNFVYDNAYGNILRRAYNDPDVCYKLSLKMPLEKIEEAAKAAFDLHDTFRKSDVEFKPEYKESKILFEILHYPYTDALQYIYRCSKAANSRYFILTGSAGNGKTNLLCSISELLLNLKEAVIFLNARDIEGDALEFLFHELGLPKFWINHKKIYLFFVNLLLAFRHKHLFIIIDAINENDHNGFGGSISKFIYEITKFSRTKVIVSCRNEYYKERFRKYLVENVDTPAFEFDLKTQEYTPAAIEQIIRAYSEYFNYGGNIAPAVRNTLSKQLLLLRIFFEVNKNSNADVFSIRKHEIFAQYIETVKNDSGEYIAKIFDIATDIMIEKENYDEVDLSDLESAGIAQEKIKKAIDSSILLSKKLVSHEGTIARNENEVLYFVFDEMRDYYLARRILLKNSSADTVDGNAVLEKLKKLRASNASCEEGVIHYCYVFFRTDKIVAESNQTEKMCNSILDLYRLPEGGRSNWGRHHREEFQNLGLKIIFTSGIELSDFEIAYIQDCLRKDPNEDGGIFFDVMLDGTLYGGTYDLGIYLDIVFGLKNKDAICRTLHTVIVRNSWNNRYIPQDLIKYYNQLIVPERKLQIQRIAELLLICFRFGDTAVQQELEDFFYSLTSHDKVQEEMMLRIRETCN